MFWLEDGEMCVIRLLLDLSIALCVLQRRKEQDVRPVNAKFVIYSVYLSPKSGFRLHVSIFRNIQQLRIARICVLSKSKRKEWGHGITHGEGLYGQLQKKSAY